MTARTAWTAGNAQGYAWTPLFNTADLASMASANAVLSSIADLANQTAQDQFMDVSIALAISSNTIASGKTVALFLYPLNQDGTTYGDNQFTAGTASSRVPGACYAAIGTNQVTPGVLQIPPLAATTSIVGISTGIILPPGSFRMVLQQTSGFTLTSGTQTVQYRTYNINLNN